MKYNLGGLNTFTNTIGLIKKRYAYCRGVFKWKQYIILIVLNIIKYVAVKISAESLEKYYESIAWLQMQLLFAS